MGSYSNQPICEADWIDQSATWGPGGELLSLHIPVRLTEPKIERCAWCGGPTILGAYVRVETVNVLYPTTSDDQDL